MLVELLIAAVHILLASAAGLLLWKLWRRLARSDETAGTIVGAGLMVRAFGAQALFWVSYLQLPIARSLQEGEGFWKFALDSETYFGFSRTMLATGWQAVVLVSRSLPSPVFLQSLAVFLLLFGVVVSVGAFLNLFAYLAGCAAVLRIGTVEGRSRRATLIALVALAFSPSLVLWSTQPLKDAFFISAVAIFVAACSAWRRAWVADHPRPVVFFAAFTLALAAIYAVVGVRWYFGILLLALTIPFLATIVVGSGPRLLAGLANAGFLVLMLEVVVLGSEPYLPPALAHPLTNAARPAGLSRASPTLVGMMARTREGFERAPAQTQIRVGTALARLERQPPAATASDSPQSAFTRVIAGVVAVVVPRFAGEALGIIHVAGGSGMWPVIEVDTLLFDVVLSITLFYAVRGIRTGAMRDPLFWFVALMTGGITILLTYTISNFGTLLRHRSMILMGLCLQLAVTRAAFSRTAKPELEN